jgi:LacI family transcriptional regulator
VSVALVSIVMRDVPGASASTRERVRRVAADLGYRPDQRARLLRQQRTRLLGVVFEVEQAFHGDLLEGLYASAETAGYNLVLSAIAPARPEAKAIEAILDDRCEAVILLGPRSSTKALTALATRLPVVAIARNVRSATVDCVRTDDRVGMHLAVGHLTTLGHQHIAYLDGGSSPGASDRLRALRAAGTAHGLTGGIVVLPGGPTEEDGVAGTRRLLAEAPKVTAVIAFNDRCAMGVLDTLLRNGIRVPHDVSVVGYDDSRLSRISYVDLTTVGQNPRQLAELAVVRAIASLENQPSDPRDQVVEPRLAIRSTTAAVRD